MATGPRRQPAFFTVAPPSRGPTVIGFLEMYRRELGKLQVAERRGEEVIDDFPIPFVRLRRDFLPNRCKPGSEPFPDGDPVGVHMLAGIERAEKAPEFSLSVLA